MICLLADIKTRLGIATTDTDNDDCISAVITGIDSLFERLCNRKLIVNDEDEDVTEYCAGAGMYLQLRRYPIVSITSVKEAVDFDFASATALIADTDYRVISPGADNRGILWRMYADWLDAPDSIQVIYRGGFTAAGAEPGEGEYAMPADLREAAIEQGCFIYKRKDDIGLSAVSFNGGSFNKFAAMNLLPMVKDILDSYRRRVI